MKNILYTLVTIFISSLAEGQTVVDDSPADEDILRAALTNLRNAALNAMVTTYTYDPLIGTTSITDPKGYTMYYEYDDFNRLKLVKDGSGKILSQNEYHYKGQPLD